MWLRIATGAMDVKSTTAARYARNDRGSSRAKANYSFVGQISSIGGAGEMGSRDHNLSDLNGG